MRGSSGLPGAADTIIRVNRTDDYATLRVEKQKDSEDGQELQLRSQVVNIPPEPDSMTSRCSLVMVPDVDEADAAPRCGHLADELARGAW